MKTFGIIGYPVSHSFSKAYFADKWSDLGIEDHVYELLPIEHIADFRDFLTDKKLSGLNVTIPHKQAVIPFLDELDTSAEKIGAVNVIKFSDGKLVGFNSDYYGFRLSLEEWIGKEKLTTMRALVLGTGGASKAVEVALEDLKIPFKCISRSSSDKAISYQELRSEGNLADYELIINTTPLGMHPNVDCCPDLDYDNLSEKHFLYDLVYNPVDTLFMKKGREQGSKALNGLRMLHLQADKAWEIWNL